MLNLTCPICGNAARTNGKTKAGSQRYRCKSATCGKSWTNSGNVQGSKSKNGKAMSNAERRRQWYAALSAEERAKVNKRWNRGRRKNSQ